MKSPNTRQNRSTWKLESFALAFCLLVILLTPALALAQTSSFTYQGRFTDGGTAATGTYDMQFKLFDTASAGSQIGSTPDSDLNGYNFWLNQLNQFGGNYIDAEMINAFITSFEYRQGSPSKRLARFRRAPG